MKLLLDTHVIIWALTNDPRLSEKARHLISSEDHIICISVASLWEVAIKNQKKPEKCPYHENSLFDYCIQAGYEALPILPSHVKALRGLQLHPNRAPANLDPFDRLLLAQAKAENCLFLTHDHNFSNYQEDCLCLV